MPAKIENYIPELLIKKKYNKENSRCCFGQFQNIEEFIDKLKKGVYVDGKKVNGNIIPVLGKGTHEVVVTLG